MPPSREKQAGLKLPALSAERLLVMRNDLLYSIFEHYLFNALVENETTEEFLAHVVREYLNRLAKNGAIAHGHLDSIEEDLRDEILEMLRKKTYGHYSLSEFRKAHTEKQRPSSASNAGRDPLSARRSRRES